MSIRTGELAPSANPSVPVDAPRYYWRSTVYDKYMGAGWGTSSAPPQSYKANTPLIPGLLEGYRPLRLDVQLARPEGKLFWSGILYNVDIPFRAGWRIPPQSSLFADQTALLQADIFAATTTADSYRAEVYIPAVTIDELRNASTEYPEEIRDRYLQLPGELPGRVVQLAKQIAREKPTPYDKAKAIESYLRTNYPYDLEVPAPPGDEDVADYFIFELRRGYCDYYATAMVVMARANGLPSRFVSGYASGSYDAPNARYRVRELDAHSWPEIYFPGIGWIEFEPTASQPEIERLQRTSGLPDAVTRPTSASRLLFQLTSKRFLYLSSPFIVTFLFIILYFTFIEAMLFKSLPPLRAISSLYRRYYRLGRPLAGERTRAETAHEFTIKLLHRIEEIGSTSRRKKLLRHIQADVQQFTKIYLWSLFSKHTTQTGDASAAFALWKRLRWQLMIVRIDHMLIQARQRMNLRRWLSRTRKPVELS